MELVNGIHFYVNIKNIIDIIKQEETKDEDLKRTIHRLQTYFCGLTKLIGIYDGEIEKYTGGRAHVVFQINEDSQEAEIRNVLRSIVACFIYNNDIFNCLSKYTQYNYPDFKVHAGMDFGKYTWFEIEDSINGNELTTIGGVANNSAKIQSYAYSDYIYVMDKLYEKLTDELKEKFVEISETEKEKFSDKIKNSKIYKVNYNNLLSNEEMEEIAEELDPVKKRVEEEANKLNISEITFSNSKTKIDFSKLSINNNKKIDGGVLCGDITGFTKLFNKSDNNLADLSEVMEEIYKVMGDTISEEEGVKVQYQGDRIVAVFNDFGSADPYRIRMVRSALKLNERIQELNDIEDISEKLKKNKVFIGIGCAAGNLIATRLGMNGNKDNIILSEAAQYADTCEEVYASENKVVICKTLYDYISAEADNSDSVEYAILKEIFSAIKTTGYYSTTLTFTEYQEKVDKKKEEEKQKKARDLFASAHISNGQGTSVNVQTRPWGYEI